MYIKELNPGSEDYGHKVFEYVAREAEKVFDSKLVDVVFYGSRARGDFSEESDVDIAIILDMSERSCRKEVSEFRLVVEDSMGVDENMEAYPEILPVSRELWETGRRLYFDHLREEGIRWTRVKN